MKNFIIIIICFVSITLNAQQFRYGAHISPAVGFWKIEGDLYKPTGTKFGVQAGLILEHTLGEAERFAFTTGLNLNISPGGFQTANVNPDNTNVKVWNFATKSLDLPLTFRLRSDQLNKTTLFVQYGVNFGFTVSNNITNDSGKQAGENFDYENINTSLLMGAGIEYAISEKIALIINAFFQNGVVNVLIDDANDDNMFPQQVGLKAGVLF